MKLSRLVVASIFSVACSGGVSAQKPASTTPATATPAQKSEPAQAGSAPRVNRDAAVLADFKGRIDKYMQVRKDAFKGTTTLKETKDPAKLKAAQDAMNANITAARADAKQGDIFTPEARAIFRRLLYPELKGDDGHDAKEIIKDDAPVNVPFKVNAKYPDGAPVPTVPAYLLINLPTLPEPLQYRIIGKHLILLDDEADVIVDYALNIIR